MKSCLSLSVLGVSSFLSCLTVVFFLLSGFAHAQISWERTYGGPYDDFSFSVLQTLNGDFIVCGTTWINSGRRNDVFLLKVNAKGDTLWMRTYGGDSSDYGQSVQQTLDGGYVIAGRTESFGAGFFDAYLVKTDSMGDTLWTKTFGDSSADVAYFVSQTQDSGYVLVGSRSPSDIVPLDVYLIKTNGRGDALWSKTFGGNSNDEGFCVQQTRDSGYILAGYTESFGSGSVDVYLIKTDSQGDTLWTRTFGGPSDDGGYFVQQTQDGGYIVTGYHSPSGRRRSEIFLIKTNSQGDSLWTKSYRRSSADSDAVGFCVQQTSDCGYVIVGKTGFQFDQDVFLIKTDSLGDTLWTRSFNRIRLDEGEYVQQTSDGGFILTGFTERASGGDYDVYLIKTNANGEIGVDVLPGPPGKENVEAFLAPPNPNPMHRRGVISFSLPASGKALLAVYDALGRRVRVLLDEEVKAGSQRVLWDGRSDQGRRVPSGVYFLRLEAGAFSDTKKMVVIR